MGQCKEVTVLFYVMQFIALMELTCMYVICVFSVLP
jgi:hypothetical protein